MNMFTNSYLLILLFYSVLAFYISIKIGEKRALESEDRSSMPHGRLLVGAKLNFAFAKTNQFARAALVAYRRASGRRLRAPARLTHPRS